MVSIAGSEGERTQRSLRRTQFPNLVRTPLAWLPPALEAFIIIIVNESQAAYAEASTPAGPHAFPGRSDAAGDRRPAGLFFADALVVMPGPTGVIRAPS